MIQFVARSKKNAHTQETKFYAQMAPTIPMTLKEVTEQIERECTVSTPDILAVLNALEHTIIQALRNGHAIRLGDLGSFRPTLHSSGALTPEEVNASLIKRVRCRFTPSATILHNLSLSTVNFLQVKGAKGQPSGPEIL